MRMLRRWLAALGAGSIHRQLTTALVLGTIFVTVLSSVAISWFVAANLRDNFVSQGLRVAQTFAQQSALSLAYGSPENAEEAVAATIAFPDVAAVEIIDAQGKTLVRRAAKSERVPAAHRAAVQPESPVVELDARDAWTLLAPVFAGSSSEEGESPFVSQPRRERLGAVRVVLSKRTLNKMTRDIFLSNGAISLVCAAGLVLLLQALTRRLTKPLRALAETMQSADRGAHQLRAAIAGPQEVAGMGHAFNNMMQVLEERERELMVARDQALESARVKAEFATSVSHEIRTPMNGVLGMLEILRDTQMSREQHDYVNVARNSAQALLALINNILDFSRGEAGRIELERVSFNLRELVEEAIYLVVGAAQQKYLELGYTIAADVPLAVVGDPVRLRQILVNLLGNAVKFTEMGEVALRIKCAANDPSSVLFEVQDTGIGIAEEHHDQIFKSFSQVDSSTTRKYGGSGLGLTICKQIVGFMGGKMGLRSRVGQGSTFWFQIALQQDKRIGEVKGEDLGQLRARALIVGMSGITTEFLRECLLGWKVEVVHVAGEDFALQSMREAVAQRVPFGLVVVDDIALATGANHFLKRVRSDHTLREVSIALVSRFIDPTQAGALQGQGVVARLRKPLRYPDVKECVLEALLPKADTGSNAARSDRAARQTKTALIVEDNKTNQIVAQGFLSRMGYSVTIAKDGAEGVQMAERGRFDVILMDCHMPVMDGYEATAKIRALEKSGGTRVPILAMTANSKASDLQRCRDTGMDDVLVKPLSLDRVKQALEVWVPKSKTTAAEAPQPQAVETSAQLPAIDDKIAEQLRDALGSGVVAMIDAFLGDTPGYLVQLREALATGDATVLRQVAHAIKGSSANIGAAALAESAARLESAVGTNDAEALVRLVGQVEQEYARVAQVLEQDRAGKTAAPVVAQMKDGLILVADDDRSTRTALRHALEAEGFAVEEAINGQQALSLLNKVSPDLVLLDAVMPVMDGFATAPEIRQRVPHLPIVMITALEDTDSVDRAFACGATDYIPKPIHFGVLTQRVRRIVEAARAERHVRHIAYHDSLTALPNRLRFLEHLNRLVARSNRQGRSVAVLFLDLDRFKVINDSLGHDIGDGLLKAVAQRITHSVRSDDLVARLGGDEFVVVLEDLANSKVAEAVAQKIASGLSSPFFIGGHEIFIEASIGIALCPMHSTDAGTLLKHADTAMYRAKRSGSGFAYYEDDMGQSSTRRMWLETGLRKAIERGELFLCYQPKQELKTRKIVGVEALLRWRHATEGLILPGEFIPIAEDNGLISSIGEWVLRNACEQVQRWRSAQWANFGVAVNVSARQLLRSDFVDGVARVLRDTQIPPALVELELTETAIMERAAESLESLKQLRALGLRLTVDDFGTGYSSFGYLKQLPLDLLKIDGSFTKDVTRNADDAAIVAGIIALAHSLRLEVVAEGVETIEQAAFLEEQRCDIIQGMLLSEPLTATDFEKRFLFPAASRGASLKLVS